MVNESQAQEIERKPHQSMLKYLKPVLRKKSSCLWEKTHYK